jgi:filamentous hemagglutinin
MESIIAGKPFEQIQPLIGNLSDRSVRKWYNAQDATIPQQIDRSLDIESQARQACEIRNRNRTNARDLMHDQEKRRQLDITDPNKSFEELVADKMKRKKLTEKEAIADILRTATQTRKSVNKQLGLG